MRMLHSETTQKLKTLLQEEHDNLVTELKGIARPNPGRTGAWTVNFPQFELEESGSSSDRESEADEVEEFEANLSAEDSLATRLLEINRALERMEKRTYGVCAQCKRDIPEERLFANPAAEFCIEHS